MISAKNKVNTFIDMVFLDPGKISPYNMDIEDDLFTAIIQFKKKMIICQLGILTTVQDTFFRYFSCCPLYKERVDIIAKRHCFGAYSDFPVFLALLYNCSFLVILSDFCLRNGLLDIKETAPALCKKVFGIMTRSSCDPEIFEKLLEFSTALNIPEVIGLVKSCLTENNRLFRFQVIDHFYVTFGICDVSALEKFLFSHLPLFSGSSMNLFLEDLEENQNYVTAIENAQSELNKSIQTKVLQIRIPGLRRNNR